MTGVSLWPDVLFHCIPPSQTPSHWHTRALFASSKMAPIFGAFYRFSVNYLLSACQLSPLDVLPLSTYIWQSHLVLLNHSELGSQKTELVRIVANVRLKQEAARLQQKHKLQESRILKVTHSVFFLALHCVPCGWGCRMSHLLVGAVLLNT